MSNFFLNPFSILFFNAKAKCSDSAADLDDPNFGHLDPHLNFDEVDRQENAGMTRRFSRVPPSFDSMMNSIRSITKKVEHIKGFNFSIGIPCSQKFLTSHSWSIPNYVANPKGNQGSYTLSTQYVEVDMPNEAEMAQMTAPPTPKYIMTARMESTGKLDAVLIKNLNDKVTLRLTSQFQNSDPNYAQMHLDLDYEGISYF